MSEFDAGAADWLLLIRTTEIYNQMNRPFLKLLRPKRARHIAELSARREMHERHGLLQVMGTWRRETPRG